MKGGLLQNAKSFPASPTFGARAMEPLIIKVAPMAKDAGILVPKRSDMIAYTHIARQPMAVIPVG